MKNPPTLMRPASPISLHAKPGLALGNPTPDHTPQCIDGAAGATADLAGAAANVGGTEYILSGRPGSWNDARIPDALASTVGVGTLGKPFRLCAYRRECLPPCGINESGSNGRGYRR